MSNEIPLDVDIENDPRERIIREQAEVIEQQAAQIKKWEVTNQEQSAKKPIFTENYSLERYNTQKTKQAKKESKKTPGRKPTKSKRDQATNKIDLYPENISHEQCTFDSQSDQAGATKSRRTGVHRIS